MSSNQSGSALHICIMAKEDIVQTKDCKFQSGLQVSCPYLACNFKNSQFQSAGRFPSGIYLPTYQKILHNSCEKFSYRVPVEPFTLQP